MLLLLKRGGVSMDWNSMSLRKLPKESNFFVGSSNILSNNIFGAKKGSTQMTMLCDNLV